MYIYYRHKSKEQINEPIPKQKSKHSTCFCKWMDDFNGFHVTMDKFVILFDITNNSKEAQIFTFNSTPEEGNF